MSIVQASTRIARSVIGMILGYALFVICTIVARLPFDHLGYSTSSASTLAISALVVPWAGVTGGLVTAAIVPARPMLHILPACFLIALESSWLFVTGRADGPLWFEAGAASSLIIAYVAGAMAWVYLSRRHRSKSR
ncbi:MAG: hypothetical protein ACJ8FO_07870 [Sphingomicrobium sp.]